MDRMDSEDYSTTYLKFLNDGPNGYLLHNSEVGLTDTFTTEPIFTEIEPSDWPSEGFSVLLNGSLLAEDCNNDENQSIPSDKNNTTADYSVTRETEETNKNEILPDGLFPTSDVLLRLNSQGTEEKDSVPERNANFSLISDNLLGQKNGYAMTLMGDIDTIENNILVSEETFTESSTTIQEPQNNDCQIIQFLNLDGSVTTFNRLTLSPVPQPDPPDETIESNEMQPIEVNLEAFVTNVSANKCKVCSYLCESLEGIIEHLKVKHADMFESSSNGRTKEEQSFLAPENMMSILNTSKPNQKYTIYLCVICKSGHSSKDELRQHMIDIHKLQAVSPNEEENNLKMDNKAEKSDNSIKENKEISLRTKSSLLLKLQQRALKKVKCSIKGCDLRFARDDLRLRHEECHINGQKKQFMCTVCKEKFSIWRICSMHMWKCHKVDMGLLTCPVCNKFKSNLAVRVLTHMMIHNEERPYLCGECGKSFKQLTQLQNHQAFHNKATNEAPNWLNPKQCTICERFFSSSKSLKIHVKAVHDKFKPFMCSICGHKASRKSMIELHMRQHTGEKPHQCEFCTFKCRDVSSLRKHVMTHIGSGKYQCPHCKYQSIQTSAYKNHLARKHPDATGGTYSCTDCPYSTVNETSYYAHVKWHQLSAEKEKAASAEKAKSPETIETNANGNKDALENKSTYLIKVGDLTLHVEDDDTQNSFNYCPDEPVDIGGFTIPAGQEGQMQLVLQVEDEDMQGISTNHPQVTANLAEDVTVTNRQDGLLPQVT